MFIERTLQKQIKTAARKFPVLSVTGPRQSGKTTLLKSCFPKYPYYSLEEPDTFLRIKNDMRGFLEDNYKGVIIDEAQHLPELFSYIQSVVDHHNKPGMFILSGSQNFLLNMKIAQSLAGRIGVMRLFPLTFSELNSGIKTTADYRDVLLKGFFPRLHDRKIGTNLFYSSYIQTYVERDFRQLINISDLSRFQLFLKLCAGRSGQVLNLSALANDCGIAVNTAKSWLSNLEATYTVFMLQPWLPNINKRLVKSPKLYFWDTGLLCYLLGITNKESVEHYFMKGALLENLIIADIIKSFNHVVKQPPCYYWRDKMGNEIDLIIEKNMKLIPVEIKAGKTFNSDYLKHLLYFGKLPGLKTDKKFLIYNGRTMQQGQGIPLLNWKDFLLNESELLLK